MPRKARELGPLAVKRLVHPGGKGNVTFAVGGVDGLLLQITPTGARSWILRTMVGDRRRKIGLGSYPAISLAHARERAREARSKVEEGIDPVAAKRAARAALAAEQARSLRFAEAVRKYAEIKGQELRTEKYRKQWLSSLERLANPALGEMPVAEITRQDVLRVLQPIWSDRTFTASKLRGRIEAVLAWAEVAGHREGDNPARWEGNLDQLLPAPGKVTKASHYPALAVHDAPRWITDLRSREGMATRALEFVALTAARSGEVRGATWCEVDLEAAIWSIPATRMKMGRTHRVPLTSEAVALLRSLPRLMGTDHVFTAPRGGMLSDMALSACMRRIHDASVKAGGTGFPDPVSGRPAVVHGLRSTFRQWTAERGYPRDMAEIALAHFIGSDAERAYQRSDMVERRRAMMTDWTSFLFGSTASDENVVRMHEAP